jgi:MscS family membrane protein
MKKISLYLLFFITFTSVFSQTQKITTVDLSNPNATIYTHLYFLQSDSYKPENAAKTIYGLQGEDAINKAIKIKKVLDGKGLKVDFTKVPNNSNYSDTTAYKIGNRFVLFPVRMPSISVEKYGNDWLYSRETVAMIDDLYKDTFPWQTEWLQNSIPKYGHKTLLGIQLWQYLGILIISLLSVLLFYILKRIIFFFLKKTQVLLTRKTTEKINKTIKKLTRPVVFLLIIFLIKKILPSLLLGLNANAFLILALDIAKVVFWIYVFLKLVQLVMTIYAEYTKRTHIKLDDQLVPILHHFLTGLVLFLGFLKLLTVFGIPPLNVLAGASIGGLALALASQDTVKNLIGTFMIFLDKPFHIGDWIEAGEVQGTVEQVGFRSSRIRAADTSIYQIPNSTLSEIVVNNKGLRLFRRYQTELGIRYDTPPELIEGFVNGLKELIKVHPHTNKDMFDVAFIDFGDSALKIMVNIYFEVNDWSTEQLAKHNFHMAIIKLAKALHVEFAFPSTTLMIEQFPEKAYESINYKTTKAFIEKNIKTAVSDFKNLKTENTDTKSTVGDDD